MTCAPDLFERVIGFRAWSIGRPYLRGLNKASNDHLWSIGNHAVRWDSATMTARCLRDHYGLGGIEHPDSAAPHIDCKCGIYANHQLAWPSSAPEGACIGAVAAWGRIQVHGRGFRAQHAQIVAFGYARTWSKDAVARIRRTADRFGVPLPPLTGLPALAFEFGSPIPLGMRPGNHTLSAEPGVDFD